MGLRKSLMLSSAAGAVDVNQKISDRFGTAMVSMTMPANLELQTKLTNRLLEIGKRNAVVEQQKRENNTRAIAQRANGPG